MQEKVVTKILEFKKDNDFSGLIKYIDTIKDLISEEAFCIKLLNEKGTSFLFMHDIKGAFETFEEVLAMSPLNINALYNMGNVYLYCHNNDEAIDYYERVLEQDASHAGALYNMALAFHFKEDTTKAIELMQQMLVLVPMHYGALYNLGQLYDTLGDEERSVAYQLQAIESKPDAYESVRALVGYYKKHDAWDAVIALLASYSVELSQDFTSTLILAEAYWALKQWEKAAEAYFNAVTLEEDGRVHVIQRIKKYADSGENEEGINALLGYFPEYFEDERTNT